MRADIRALRTALKPFRNSYDAIHHDSPAITRGADYDVFITDSHVPVKVSDFKRAMLALERN